VLDDDDGDAALVNTAHQGADSDQVAQAFRDDVARDAAPRWRRPLSFLNASSISRTDNPRAKISTASAKAR
jgi:hypothetical protein